MSSDDLSGACVAFDQLEFDDDLALLGGVPFSGAVRSEYPDGEREFEGQYRDGLPEGLNELWFPNGQIFRRWIAVRGAGSSESWTWYPDGTLRSYRRNGDDGLPVELAAWDMAGEVMDPVQLPSVTRADVLSELFDRASAMKEAALRAAGTTSQPDLGPES